MYDITVLVADHGMTTVDAFKHLAAPNFDHINWGCHHCVLLNLKLIHTALDVLHNVFRCVKIRASPTERFFASVIAIELKQIPLVEKVP
jgi:hypothetical protein